MFASSAGETATVLAAIVLLCAIGLALFGLVGTGRDGSAPLVWRRDAGRRRDITPLAAATPKRYRRRLVEVLMEGRSR